MARTDALPSDLLKAIVGKLRADLDLGDRQCFQTWEPDVPPTITRGGDYAVSVAFGEGNFDPALFDGGGPSQLCEEMAILVTIYSRPRLDPTDIAESALHDPDRGLFSLARRLVKVLCAWDATLDDGSAPLRELLRPARIGRPLFDKESGIGSIGIQFIALWDWDLE